MKKRGERSAGYGLKDKERSMYDRYFNPPQASLIENPASYHVRCTNVLT